MSRSRYPGKSVWEFRNPSWVVCPRCAGPARSTTNETERRHRLVCKGCAHVAELETPWLVQWVGDGTDGRFGLPLYLTIEVQGQDLWVHNLEHLDVLADWLGATLRERNVDGDIYNRAMMSRLPRWMKAASARPAVVKGLEALRAKATREGLTA